MITMRQLVTRYKRVKKKRRNLVPALEKCPFKKGTVRKVFIEKPKKPNSARRKVVRVLLSNQRHVTCHIPGINHSLSKFSVVLVRGGRAQDLIGVRYKVIRGKFDLHPVIPRITRKTKFGLK
jgi:small subunit ribosomal protein S12